MSGDRSDMALLLLGYLTGHVQRREFEEHFKVKCVSWGPKGDGPPEYCEVEFASGTTVRIRVEDVRR